MVILTENKTNDQLSGHNLKKQTKLMVRQKINKILTKKKVRKDTIIWTPFSIQNQLKNTIFDVLKLTIKSTNNG